MRTKKALLFLTAGALVLSSGCFSGNWWKWITAASQVFGTFTTGLDNLGVLTG